jgi:phosphoglycerate dehydrogenase-like enzyme
VTVLPSPEQAKNLKLAHLFSAGADHIHKDPIYTDINITITSSSGTHGPMISEWVIMQILSNSHMQKKLLRWQTQHQWGSHQELLGLTDLVDLRLGILGYGSIGRQGTVCICTLAKP